MWRVRLRYACIGSTHPLHSGEGVLHERRFAFCAPLLQGEGSLPTVVKRQQGRETPLASFHRVLRSMDTAAFEGPADNRCPEARVGGKVYLFYLYVDPFENAQMHSCSDRSRNSVGLK